MGHLKTSLSALAVSAILLGCGAANKFVGTWESQINQFGQTGSMVQTIHANGTYTGELSLKMMSNDVKIHVDGTWTSPDEKTLTLTQKKVETTGLPKEVEALAKSQIEAQKDKAQSLTVTWSGNDEFTASGAQGAGSMTFKRKK